MKAILSSRRHQYLAMASIFLIMVILIAGIAGCGTTPVQYILTVSSSAGGSVAEPGEGAFTYDEGTVVNLLAAVIETAEGWEFVEWTGDVGTVANVKAATTTITMNGDYSITANFAIATEIWDWYDLDAIRYGLVGNYTLMNDLDSTTPGYGELAGPTANEGKGWQPIGTNDDPFTGTLDGQGFEIRDLFANRPDDESFGGLFGYVGEGGVVGNIGMANATVTADVGVGGLVGMNLGTVSNSYSAGSVSGYDVVGGLLGLNIGNTSYCYFAGSVTGTGSVREVTGVGGLVGMDYGDISYCYSSGVVSGVSPVGGLVGAVYFGTVGHSYSSGSVSGQDGVGGLTGINALGTVSNSYATGSVTGTSYVGGLVGGNSNNATVSNSYSAGDVTGDANVGGLVGFNDAAATVSNSFWDTQTSGQATSGGGTGKTTAEMQDITTFSGAGWDIIAVANPSIRNLTYIWNIVDDETYPFLSWEL